MLYNPQLFKNKYRLKSTRLEGWDYGRNGWYFVTVCTKNMKCCLGEIKKGRMCLSTIGKIIKQILLTIPQHHHVKLDYWVIMPNHIHIIIIIHNHGCCRDEARLVSTNGVTSFMSQISPKPQSLPVIIGSYKSVCIKIINRLYPYLHFQWQPRFYDHVITNNQDLYRVRKYIMENPLMWWRDRNN